jgi:hypothetical protein
MRPAGISGRLGLLDDISLAKGPLVRLNPLTKWIILFEIAARLGHELRSSFVFWTSRGYPVKLVEVNLAQ